MKLYIFSNRRMLNIIYLFLGCELCVRVVGCELFWSRLAGNWSVGLLAGVSPHVPLSTTSYYRPGTNITCLRSHDCVSNLPIGGSNVNNF